MTRPTRYLIALLGVLTLLVGAVAPAMAKPRPQALAPATMTLRVLTGSDQIPNHGEVVTFDLAGVADPETLVRLDCYQGGVLVYYLSMGWFYPFPPKQFTLSSGLWTSGAADCQARAYNGRATYASLAFTAQG